VEIALRAWKPKHGAEDSTVNNHRNERSPSILHGDRRHNRADHLCDAPPVITMKTPIIHYPSRRKREWTLIVLITISGLISFGLIAIAYNYFR
jgi:hypothetical protein